APSAGAIDLAVEVASRLPPDDAARLRALGNTAERPLHVRHLFDSHEWVVRVICGGKDPATAAPGVHDRGRPQLYRTWVECSIGTGQRVCFWVDETEPPAAPGAPRDRLEVRDPEVQHILFEVEKKYGIKSKNELRTSLLREPTRSLGWLLSFVDDFLTSREVWRALNIQDPDDLEAVSGQAW